MENVKVDSSFIMELTYKDDEKSLIVTMENEGGEKRYKYLEVPESVFERFVDAPSKGRFYTRNIKGRYESVPLTNIVEKI